MYNYVLLCVTPLYLMIFKKHKMIDSEITTLLEIHKISKYFFTISNNINLISPATEYERKYILTNLY